MSPVHPPTFPQDVAASLRRIRKYAVPRSMIEQATERRLAGDWRGACAAANIEVDFDLADVARQHGAATAAAVEEDLQGFAPDLLRWHLPRSVHGWGTIRPNTPVILASYVDQPTNGPQLNIAPIGEGYGPQRLQLRLNEGEAVRTRRWSGLQFQQEIWVTARHLWDARHADELRGRCGGGDRAPFHNADGTPRETGELPMVNPGRDDPAGYSEWLTLLHERGDVEQACGEAGIGVIDAPLPPEWADEPSALQWLGRYSVAWARLEPEIRLLDAAGFGNRFQILAGSLAIVLELQAGVGLSIRNARWNEARGIPALPETCWRFPADLNLLRHGDMPPGELHPLVSVSLFPQRASDDCLGGPPEPEALSAIRVRCQGEWHKLHFADGALRTQHSAAEEQREQSMRAFGGPVAGCFAVRHAWASGQGRLPKALRRVRADLFSRARHGDTAGLIRLLDAGLDPRTRGAGQRSLLHYLPHIDYRLVLPRLLAAGLDLDARDSQERTPLFTAVYLESAALARALVDAGASIDAAAESECGTLDDLLDQSENGDLQFLRDMLDTREG